VLLDLLAGGDTVRSPTSAPTTVLEFPTVALIFGCFFETIIISLKLGYQLLLMLVQALKLLYLSFE
jgi:hypothetical protein